MIIVTEKKQTTLSEGTERILLQDFVKIVGRKTTCQAEWASKSGHTEVVANPPAFCGFNNGYFYLAVTQGILSVNFHVRSIVSITREHYDDGTPDVYFILIRDGSKIHLSLL
jgi:hypothetical protein